VHIFEEEPFQNEEIVPADSSKCDVKDIYEPWVKGKFQEKIVNTRNIRFFRNKANRKKGRCVAPDGQFILKTTKIKAKIYITSLGVHFCS
jgi:hypothetical protein